jgi:hypothetical protein
MSNEISIKSLLNNGISPSTITDLSTQCFIKRKLRYSLFSSPQRTILYTYADSLRDSGVHPYIPDSIVSAIKSCMDDETLITSVELLTLPPMSATNVIKPSTRTTIALTTTLPFGRKINTRIGWWTSTYRACKYITEQTWYTFTATNGGYHYFNYTHDHIVLLCVTIREAVSYRRKNDYFLKALHLLAEEDASEDLGNVVISDQFFMH